MAKYIVTGTISFEVTAEIEAESEEMAKDAFDTADCSIESQDGDITITDCCQSSSDIDEVKWPAAEKWESMSKLERANVLKENGVSDDEAFEAADDEFLSDIDDEYWKYFEE